MPSCQPTSSPRATTLQASAEPVAEGPEGAGCFGMAWGALDIAEEELVPEPATIMLLGSGLMGLAGYATLLWRAKEQVQV